MTYNLTNLTAQGSFIGVIQWANDSTSQILFGLMLVASFFIMLVVLKRYEFEGSLAASSWIAFVFGVILWYGGWVAGLYPLGFLVLSALTSLYMWSSGRTV